MLIRTDMVVKAHNTGITNKQSQRRQLFDFIIRRRKKVKQYRSYSYLIK